MSTMHRAASLSLLAWTALAATGDRALAVPADRLEPGNAAALKPSSALPKELAEVGFDQRLGASVPLDLAFVDETGKGVRLGDFFGQRPVLLVPVYYDCPMLCTQVLNTLVEGLKAVPFLPGKEYEVVAVSFDPSNTVEDALLTKNTVLGRFGHRDAAGGWHFLVGSPESIRRFTEAIGFRFKKLENSSDFAHTAGVVLATPQGKLARYFFGLDYPGRDLRLAMVDASEERIGSVVDHVFLYCFRYDPTTGKYTALTLNIVRLAGALTVALLAVSLFITVSRERRRNRTSLGTA